MIMKSGIVGKVQYEDIQTIWNVYLPSPKEIEDICQEYMDDVIEREKLKYQQEYTKKRWFDKLRVPKPSEMDKILEDITLKHFFSDSNFERTNFDYFQQMYQSAQTIKLVLKVKRVGVKCSNNLYVEECYLDAIKDVVNHLDYYENILNNYREDFDIE